MSAGNVEFIGGRIKEGLEKLADSYHYRTLGLAKKARRDREAQARTDALGYAMTFLKDQSPTYRATHVIKAADQFADYILNGSTKETGE